MEVIVNNFSEAFQELNMLLKNKKTKTFNPAWIKLHSPDLHKYLCGNFQNGTGDVDWDFITSNLDLSFQKRWRKHEKKITVVPYENKEEVSVILTKYNDKLYTLMAPLDKEDQQIQDQIMIRLVRCAQKGNSMAKEHVIECTKFIIYEWMESSRYLARWKGYTNDIEDRIQGCIRNYRYSGSFMNYVFRTFQYSARGLRPICSLDDKFRNSTKRRIDYVAQEEEYLYG
jgi:hypothetical protein